MDPRTEKMLAERGTRPEAASPSPRASSGAMKNAKLLATVGAVILFAVYYVLVALPAQQQDRQELKARDVENIKASVTARQDAMSDCLTKAQTEADARWTAACKAKREGPTCTLPENQTRDLERTERDARNACLLSKDLK